jgi:hypothetical protein
LSARVRLLATAAVAALTLSLAGCLPSLPFGPGSTVPGGSGPGGSGGGEALLPSASLPADWPGELPLPDGQLITATSIDGTHSLVYRVADAGVGQRLVDDVVGRGFTLEASSDMGQLVANVLSRDGWNVTIGWLIDDDDVTLTYVSGAH